ncbi:hypothetical protein [Micromonospora coerulea]|uniref:hypothetical protein n=1 Tax=Micromonospora coerulea TaxID=47856 RepID=UPI0019066228|nr:hypothetical protein [Micromonospora veneta]
MTRHGGRLTRLALRLGLLLAGVSGAWIAYDAVTGDAAYAADPAPAGTVTRTVDLLRAVPSPVLRTTPTDRSDRSAVAVPPTRTDGPTPDPPPPAASTRPAPAPLTRPDHAARGTSPQRRPGAAPTRPAPRSGRATTSPSPTGEPIRVRPAEPASARLHAVSGQVVKQVATGLRPVTRPVSSGPLRPVAAGLRPVTTPVVDGLGPVLNPVWRGLGPVWRGLGPVWRGLGPVWRGLGPVLRPLDPVLEPLDPVREILQPSTGAPAPPPIPGPGLLPTEVGTPPDSPRGTPPGHATAAAPPLEVAGRTPSTAAATPQPAATVRHWSPHAGGGGHRHPGNPLRSNAGHLPLALVSAWSSAGSPGASHSVAANASAGGWTPRVVMGRPCRSARPDGLSSRSPRPGTRPA